MKACLTVYFVVPFRVGVFERFDEGKLSVCKVVFGAEPKKSPNRRFSFLTFSS